MIIKKNTIIVLGLLSVFSFSPLWASVVTVEQDEKNHQRLLVDGKPYLVKGVEYRVSAVGQTPDKGTLRDWATYDVNENDINDVAYESYVDTNQNDKQDADEPSVGDFQLLKEMGVNTIRWYVNSFPDQKPNKKLLRDLYARYGIRVAVGNYFGAYTIESGASWSKGTDYIDFAQRQKILAGVRKMVLEHKDEPYVLMWILGNENNLRFANTNAERYPDAYASLLGEAARMIKKLDGKHPIALCNGDVGLLRYYGQYCKDIDIFGANVYRGAEGFGSLFDTVKKHYGKPVLLTEYGGAEANGFDEDRQASYHKNAWEDIRANAAGSSWGAGNAIGGFAFEWVDEWWKAGDPFKQAFHGSHGKQGVGAAAWSQEYCGISAIGPGDEGHRNRKLRKVYFTYQKLWV